MGAVQWEAADVVWEGNSGCGPVGVFWKGTVWSSGCVLEGNSGCGSVGAFWRGTVGVVQWVRSGGEQWVWFSGCVLEGNSGCVLEMIADCSPAELTR